MINQVAVGHPNIMSRHNVSTPGLIKAVVINAKKKTV